ncbi:MAG: S8 family serine peptidase [Chloroflexi bacterium]|nr:S8 family serine peptidase [Chloroflexota bacterium]
MRQKRLPPLRTIIIASVALAWLIVSRPGPDAERGVYIPHPDSQQVAGQLTVQFADNIPEDRWDDILAAHGAELERPMLVEGFAVVSVPDDRRSEIGEALAASGVVRTVEAITYRYPAAIPNDELWIDQWNLRLISADNAWDTTQGEGVVVAVIDTGVAYENFGNFKQAPDLAGTTIVDPYDFYNDDGNANDDNGHGTHIAGTIAQTTNNSYGLAGIAYKTSIMPVKVCGPVPGDPRRSQCSTTAIADGIRWAAEHGAKVINMSLSDPDNVTVAESEALEFALSTGAVLIAAAGNGGADEEGDGGPVLGYPAAVPIVIAVSASGFFGSLAYYSNYGVGVANTNVDVIAPGGNPPSGNGSIPNEGPTSVITQESYRFFCDPVWPVEFQTFAFCPFAGTSMAAAHVSGVAALIRSAYPNLNGTQVRALIQCSAADVGDPGIDLKTGHGLVQADAAVRDTDGDHIPDCIDNTPFTPTPSPTPSPTPIPPPNDCLVTPTPTPSPTPTPTATPTPPTSPTATATDTPVPTATPTGNVTGTPSPTATVTFSPTPLPISCGDVNCSGTVDTHDALGIIRFLVFAEPVADCISKGYVNCDGVLDPADALVILRYAGGLPLGLPAGCPGPG